MSRSSVIWSQVYGSEFGRFEKNEQNMLGLGKTFFCLKNQMLVLPSFQKKKR